MQVILRTIEGEKAQHRMRDKHCEPQDAIPCLRCGTCCTRWQPQIGEDELPALAQGLALSPEDFFQKYIYTHPTLPQVYLLRQEKNACIFLRHEQGLASCAIHSCKPAVCRHWSPSLSRPECREGLRKRGGNNRLLLPQGGYPSSAELIALCHLYPKLIPPENKALL